MLLEMLVLNVNLAVSNVKVVEVSVIYVLSELV